VTSLLRRTSDEPKRIEDQRTEREARNRPKFINELDRQEAEKLKRKLEAELGRVTDTGAADPPPELSPAELKERDLIARLDRLEGREQGPLPQVPNVTAQVHSK
jgi:hypothetical protein